MSEGSEGTLTPPAAPPAPAPRESARSLSGAVKEAGREESCPAARDRGSPWKSLPNCFVYEALGRVSSGFPNELVCC